MAGPIPYLMQMATPSSYQMAALSSAGRTLVAMSHQSIYGNRLDCGSIVPNTIYCLERNRPFSKIGGAYILPAESPMSWPITLRDTRGFSAGLVVRRVCLQHLLRICSTWVSERQYTILTLTLRGTRQQKRFPSY